MINFDRPDNLLGLQADSSIVMKALEQIDHKGLVRIGRGETDAYVNNESLGVSMLFESERYAHSKYGVTLPSEAPILVAVFLYGPNHPDFREYRGTIYGGLQFSDSQAVVKEKLGPSAMFSEKFNSESWNLNDKIGLIVDYSDSRNSIKVIQFGIEL